MREANSESDPIWVTQDSRNISISMMSIHHLQNLEKYLSRYLQTLTPPTFEGEFLIDEPHPLEDPFRNWIEWCQYELSRRE